MSKSPRIIDNLGPYIAHPPVRVACELSKKTFERFHQARGGAERSGETGKEHLLTRLMYMAESTSTAVRLNATWSLSLPAMSLLRDRYEQVVRFSWLARQTDSAELAAFIDMYYAKAAKVFGNTPPMQWAHLAADLDVQRKLQAPLSKQEREHLSRWENLDLRSMAQKRDRLPPKTTSPVEGQMLSDLYTAIYQQFSSVSHGDMFGLNILGFHKNPAGQVVMAPDPEWPAMLCIFNSMFDIVQCHDALTGFADKPAQPLFDDLLYEWIAVRDKVLGNDRMTAPPSPQ
jgi:hypothetical protein